jgi:hypothetical protein
MPAGAPSKYKEAYCQEVINHCADGSSLTSFAAEIGVARDTISEWAKVHPEFSAAVKKAKAKCAAWWEKTARQNAVTGNGNATLCIFGLKNMGAEDWRDKQEVEHSGGFDVRHIELTGSDDHHDSQS